MQEWQEKISVDRFSGRTVIVTGAGSGIGRATASRLAREGGRVIAVDVDQRRISDLETELSSSAGSIMPIVADVSSDDGIDEIMAAAGDWVDGLANVAGIMDDMAATHEVDTELWDRILAVNVTGPLKLMKAVIPGMLHRGSGTIVNVTSEAGLRGAAAGTAYTTSKHALIGLTVSSAYMYARSGLRINAVAPGEVATNIAMPARSVFGAQRVEQAAVAAVPSIAQAEQLAASITFLMSDDSTNINGAVLPSDGGWSTA
ncbi:SDR family NAD(P)-dependent oxidoreductase [Corynebacterium glyciniphilum]|uniref:SDR family NAD(P)-dependent oxidoreductase n=1 Tax=Corynebacterium glyciniphilum TaxID=1404244 RepID=UPI003DA06130